jgi:hypothetical protein
VSFQRSVSLAVLSVLTACVVAGAQSGLSPVGRTSLIPALKPQAQTQGSLHGVVIDPDGKPIPNAAVTLTGKGVEKTLICDEHGEYTFGRLPSGDYKLKASAVGYQTFETPVTLGSSTSLEMDPPLIPALGNQTPTMASPATPVPPAAAQPAKATPPAAATPPSSA